MQLNTAHPLYADLIALICVDDDGVIRDLKGDTCTPDPAVVIGTGAYGRHFKTSFLGGNALGVVLAAGFQTQPIANAIGTTFVAVNAISATAGRGSVFDGSSTYAVGPAISSGVAAFHPGGTANPTLPGVSNLLGGGTHSFGVAYNLTPGSQSLKVFADGVVENSGAATGNANDNYRAKTIGGAPTGGYGYCAASYVWVAHFRRILSNQEIVDLHGSLGANNAFGLVISGGVVPDGAADPGTGQSTGSGSGGDGSAAGAGMADAGTGTSTGSGTGGDAAGQKSGTFVTDAMENNSGAGLLANTNVVWTWVQGSIGQAPASLTHGTGATSAAGVLTASGIPLGDGYLIAATADGSGVYYQFGHVA